MFTIGTVVAIGDPAYFKQIVDDRVSNNQVIGGTYLEDLGINVNGLSYETSLTLTDADFAALWAYRAAGTKPSVTDPRGNSLGARAFKIKSSVFIDGCPYRQVELEILRG